MEPQLTPKCLGISKGTGRMTAGIRRAQGVNSHRKQKGVLVPARASRLVSRMKCGLALFDVRRA